MSDLLATSGDYLRVWRAGEPETKLECLLNNNKNSDFWSVSGLILEGLYFMFLFCQCPSDLV